MVDFESLIAPSEPDDESVACEPRRNRRRRSRDRDDLSGLFLNMGKKIDIRELFIIWIMFLFLHTEMFAEHVLKRFSGACNDDCTPTMKGTILASILMMLVIMLCAVVF